MPEAKRIVVLSDGTGNAAASIWRTNVWRVFELLDLTSHDQVAKYDDGIGSSPFKPFALLAGAFGYGFKRNLIDLYKFVCRNYEPGDRIYAFGFSRGAYTVRTLILLILQQGLVPYHSESDLHARARDAYRAFRAENFHSILRIESLFRRLRNVRIWAATKLTGRTSYNKSSNRIVDSIEFIGVWDTVAAYGLPIDEMTRGVSKWLYPFELPERALDGRVQRACHAIAIDDERTTFQPVLWTEEGENPPLPDINGNQWLKDERISQVWFAGAHSNVGGGYPDDSLAYLPLLWIMEEARFRGLKFKKSPHAEPDAFRKVRSAGDKDGRQYDSRSGFRSYYRYGPRKIAELCDARFSRKVGDAVHIPLPKIHESVLARMRSDRNAYAPIGLPANYAVATVDGRIAQGKDNHYETLSESNARAREQEKVWNLVWMRRVVYFFSLATSFYLAVFWLFHERDAEHEYASHLRPVSEFVRFIGSFLPSFPFRWWVDWYATNPGWFLCGVGALCLFLWISSKLREQIIDTMRHIWKSRMQQSTSESSLLHSAIYGLRTNAICRAFTQSFKYDVLPAFGVVFSLFLLWVVITPLTHLISNMVDSTGVYCRETERPLTVRLTEGSESRHLFFRTNELCAATAVYIERGGRYIVTITVSEGWADGDFPTDPVGYQTSQLSSWSDRLLMRVAVPLRRVIFRRWFTVVGRVGTTGTEEIFLDVTANPKVPNTYESVIRAYKSGELFLYVNDAVLPLPWIADSFYWRNRGTAQVVIRRIN